MAPRAPRRRRRSRRRRRAMRPARRARGRRWARVAGSRAPTTGTATAVAGIPTGPDGTRVRPGGRSGMPAGGLATPGAGATSEVPGMSSGPSSRASADGDPGRGPSSWKPFGVDRVPPRRLGIAFGVIVRRTSRLGTGRRFIAWMMAAPTAVPSTMPRARNAISEGLTNAPVPARVRGPQARASVAAPLRSVNRTSVRRARARPAGRASAAGFSPGPRGSTSSSVARCARQRPAWYSRERRRRLTPRLSVALPAPAGKARPAP